MFWRLHGISDPIGRVECLVPRVKAWVEKWNMIQLPQHVLGTSTQLPLDAKASSLVWVLGASIFRILLDMLLKSPAQNDFLNWTVIGLDASPLYTIPCNTWGPLCLLVPPTQNGVVRLDYVMLILRASSSNAWLTKSLKYKRVSMWDIFNAMTCGLDIAAQWPFERAIIELSYDA